MPNVARNHTARQMFDKITKRHPAAASRTTPNSQAQLSPSRKGVILVDPVEHFNQNDVLKSWTSKISSLVRGNRPQEAIFLFKTMLLNEQSPNFVTVLSAIKAVGLMGSKDLASAFHGHATKTGVIAELPVVTAFIGVYSSFDMESAWFLFDQTPNKDVVLWSAMVSACVNHGEYLEAFNLIKDMVYSGAQPNEITIASILSACADLNLGKEIHGRSIRMMLYHHTLCGNSLVNMYLKCGQLEEAVRVFDYTWDKDLVSWKIMIQGYIDHGFPRKALETFLMLRSSRVCKVDEYIIQEVIRAYSSLDENYVKYGLQGLLLKTGYLLFVPVVTELLQVYAKFGEMESARNLFDELDSKDVISWSVMIAVYSQSSHSQDAFDILRQMQLADQKPNEFTFVSLLVACTSAAALEIGESLHAQITKYGYLTNTFLTSALIDIYSKFGRTQQGQAVFDENPEKDLICWSSMINGYGINGCGEEVVECFSNMISYGIEPNDVVFISVLSACSHCGLEYEGWNYFRSMEAKYDIAPKLPHYACMVDMLSRQGNVEEALEFINNMPVEPDKRIWGALLAGCRNTNGPMEILELVAKKLIDLDPENTSYYVIISNLYADQGRWEEVESLRNAIDAGSLKKVAGYSTI